MTIEEFTKLASAIQSLIFAIGIIVGGVWALFRFRSLKSIERAKTDLDKLRRSLEARGILNITMKASQVKEAKSSHLYIAVDVTIENKGNRTEVLNWENGGFQLTKTHSNDSGELLFGKSTFVGYQMPNIQIVSSSILPGQKRMIPFLLPILEPGVYHLLFSAQQSPVEKVLSVKEHAKVGVVAEAALWQSMMFLNVE